MYEGEPKPKPKAFNFNGGSTGPQLSEMGALEINKKRSIYCICNKKVGGHKRPPRIVGDILSHYF